MEVKLIGTDGQVHMRRAGEHVHKLDKWAELFVKRETADIGQNHRLALFCGIARQAHGEILERKRRDSKQ